MNSFLSGVAPSMADGDAVHAFAGLCQIAAGACIEPTDALQLVDAIQHTVAACPETLSPLHMWPVAVALVGLGQLVLRFRVTPVVRNPDVPITCRQRAIQVLECILAQHSCPSLGLRDVAGWLGVSEPYLCEALHDVSSQGFYAHLHAIRVLHATVQLADGHESVGRIARACGFYTAPHLTRVFRTLLHTTPGRFRRVVDAKNPFRIVFQRNQR
jgi:AraC-like DNA-binding protein